MNGKPGCHGRCKTAIWDSARRHSCILNATMLYNVKSFDRFCLISWIPAAMYPAWCNFVATFQARSLPLSVSEPTYSFQLRYLTKWSYYKHHGDDEKSLVPASESVVSWSWVLSREERRSRCRYRAKIEGVIVCASWPKFADPIATIVCAHRLILKQIWQEIKH